MTASSSWVGPSLQAAASTAPETISGLIRPNAIRNISLRSNHFAWNSNWVTPISDPWCLFGHAS